ncbi:putative enoyl-CoA hydratase/isomerase family protein [Gordonia araii NBRC 100433]|uniref:Putative enoyl-CoA hydratase/isomerase family protein n=1 Tax=Gordonia araii NBRC 100433 TaxID=1073574 RepID=G7H378_9ACTN|nr:crotonase/enoyl-CoA hydratase family protein [Gordonia araii]NNG96421.1 crotonase/enoyl-CoA hydratase family protein [Gordonia araii NBRC 100433]GAB10303.1 putative enoyl-CoA hydratase/isomerase family protein [Gordonia araii NBRC 100433]
MNVTVAHDGPVTTITLNRPEVRNAVDRPTADALANALREFEADDDARVAVLTGAEGTFCAGADLVAVAEGGERRNQLTEDGDAPMGPSRMRLAKPLIAAIEGHAVAGGLELALLADLRVMASDAIVGVFCRRFGVPLIDGGTVRLPRIVGQGRALDLILTGRAVTADEAFAMGLANRVVDPGTALAAAQSLAAEIAGFPQACMLADRASAYGQWGLEFDEAMRAEFRGGLGVVASGETVEGAERFRDGAGRHGDF